MNGYSEEFWQRRLDRPDSPATPEVDRAAEAFREVRAVNDQVRIATRPRVPARPRRIPVRPVCDDSWIETYAGIVLAIIEREQGQRGGGSPGA